MNSICDKPACNLLLVDQDRQFREHTAQRLGRRGYHVEEATSGEQALQLGASQLFDVALLDTVLPELNPSGMDVLQRLRGESDCEVIVLTGQGTIETAVQAIKLGAYDFLTKPAQFQHLNAVVDNACHAAQVRKENRRWQAVIDASVRHHEMIGESTVMQEIYRLIQRAGPADKPVLIQGETGTGKELVARALHKLSPRAGKPMVTINCAALPDLLLESELFGHEKGAFTGATAAKPGLFEVADGGTLFIDEIGEMPPMLQAKLLRVVEDGWLRRVGALRDRRVDVRLLTATNRKLDKEVSQGRFRKDLFYRIDVLQLELPPLRRRDEDVPLLAFSFAGGDWSIEDDALSAIRQFYWPGNVRQLINAIDRAKILADDQIIRLHNLPPEIVQATACDANRTSLAAELVDSESVKRRNVERIMARERGNKSHAARALGISRRTLNRWLDKYKITT